MKKIFIVLIAFLISSALSVVPTVIQADIVSAVSYLQNQPLADWTVQALAAAGVNNINQDWLEGFSNTQPTAIEKRILTLAALGENPENYYSDRDLVAELISHYQNGQLGEITLLNDDFFGVLALASVNKKSLTVFSDSAAYVVANQNNDGGWSYAVGGDSDTNDTAAAVMALLEAGYSSSDMVISKALAYLQSAVNSDYGWGWAQNSQSDSASTAWVVAALNKAGQAVSNQSVDYLYSLQTSDGSFKWQAGDNQGSPVMTAYAIIALRDRYFPIGKINLANLTENYLRIEGSNETVCEGYFSARTALHLVEVAAAECGYSYEIESTSYGPYLRRINNDEAQGLTGWLYRADWLSPAVGANDYILSPGQEVLWYFGDWQWPPSRLILSKDSIAAGETVLAQVDYIDSDNNWLPLAGAVIAVGEETYQSKDNGRVEINFSQSGVYTLRAVSQNFIRSNSQIIAVGEGVNATIGWQVSIVNDKPAGADLSLRILDELVDFGNLQPGQMGLANISVQNDGQLSAHVEAIVSGPRQLIDNFKLKGVVWTDYEQTLSPRETVKLDARLYVPPDYQGSGRQGGDVVFWATVAD